MAINAKALPSIEQIRAEQQRRKELGFHRLYPEDGLLSRFNYPKHMEFFRAGAEFQERAAIAANRIGKSFGIGGFEVSVHATGEYPSWWEGHRFEKPVRIIAAGDTNQSTRDIVQMILLGPPNAIGTGLIPKANIISMTRKPGVPDAFEKVYIRHKSGRESIITFMSYAQGREQFQGVKADIVWFDEEAKRNIWEEAMMRTMTENGMGILTYTPLSGWSSLVTAFLDPDHAPTRWAIGIGWDDVPHLSKEQIERMKASCEPHLLDARSKGIPSLGSGAIYPVTDDAITVDDFAIPDHWPRAYGMDVGWNWTASVNMALDRDSGTAYIYRVYKGGKQEPPIHAQAIKAPGDWIPGVCDYSGTDQSTGARVIQIYQDLGLHLQSADKKGKEADIFNLLMAMTEGRLKVFKTCKPWFDEKNLYRRDESGKIVKEHDHLMDATQYVYKVLPQVAKTKPTALPTRNNNLSIRIF